MSYVVIWRRKCIPKTSYVLLVPVFFLYIFIYSYHTDTTVENEEFVKELDYTKILKLKRIFSRNDNNNSKERIADEYFNFTEFEQLKICNVTRDKLKGREEVFTDIYNFNRLEQKFPGFNHGRFRPKKCKPKSRIAIIIPYRDREIHLKQLFLNMIPKLQRQQQDFNIFVIEQSSHEKFNRGLIRNIGFLEARKRFHFDCYIFNDADTVIEDDRNIYKCGLDTSTRHLISGVRRYNYSLPYRGLVGGIIAITEQQMIKLNGYSNMFFMWGGEDDNLFRRMIQSSIGLDRTDYQDGFVTTLAHKKDKKVPSRLRTLSKTSKSRDFDGINSVRYKVVWKEYKPLFTWIVVDVNRTLINEDFEKAVRKANKERERLRH